MSPLPLLAHREAPAGRLWLAAALALATALALTSCAPASNDVQKDAGSAILAATGRALTSARSLEIRAVSTQAGGPASITFEIEGPNQGEGTFTSSTVSFQAEELRGVDYFRSQTLWSQVGGASLQSDLGDRWVFIAASSSTAAQLTQAFGELTSVRALAGAITKGAATAVRGRVDPVAGTESVAVRVPPSQTIYVATTGKPYPLRWVQSATASVSFSHFGDHFHLKAPRKPLNLAAILGH